MADPQWLWMGVRPGPASTRILIQETQQTVLKARLPESPAHPRALETLAEGIALWCGRPLYVALGVAASDALCVLPPWHATVDVLTRTPLVTIEPVIDSPRPPWRVADRGELGNFRDVRTLRRRGRQP
jgi:hypothetical protein